MSVRSCFLEPLDVLFLRGNRLFGDPGSYGEALVPPWPSVAAGAIRSHLLVSDGLDPGAFARGECEHPALGHRDRPGAFAVVGFHLARRDGRGRIETLWPVPADLVVKEERGSRRVAWARPVKLAESLRSSLRLPLHPVLAEAERSKPAKGLWLREEGWRRYLDGDSPEPEHLVESSRLWKLELRVGVGLDPARRAAGDGRLFTVQAVSLARRDAGGESDTGFDAGFLVRVAGLTGPLPPGTVRFGADGRAARLFPIDSLPKLPEADQRLIARDRRARLVLTSPGIFPGGWLPPGCGGDPRADGAIRFALGGVSGWLVSAAVPRLEVISGWDLARWRPKAAERAVPAGAVYWLELDEGVAEDGLAALAAQGLWSEPCEDPLRRAEGYNRFAWARWRIA
ncbi:MAG: type III-B CRISPR module-associated Cmr3 family protein [Xanthomonadales bacterium]|nr:type III-B CRISPR module-associated Cmr3 family protein [Xanthomonadales bacterium]